MYMRFLLSLSLIHIYLSMHAHTYRVNPSFFCSCRRRVRQCVRCVLFACVYVCLCVCGYVLGYELVHMYPGQPKHSTTPIWLSQQALLRAPTQSSICHLFFSFFRYDVVLTTYATLEYEFRAAQASLMVACAYCTLHIVIYI